MAQKDHLPCGRIPPGKTAQGSLSVAGGWEKFVAGVFLVLAIVAVFGQTLGFGFVGYDDNENVYENPVVQRGLSLQGVGWAFVHPQTCNWVPLTTLSHMLDCQLFGLDAGAHHLVNLWLHAATAVLLFLVLQNMTGALWRSVFVAAVFALHPLRAESVAWISERKDVLSAFFFMLTVGGYVRYVRKPSGLGFSVVVLWFTLGLLSKSMLVTLPLVLLLLDYWPLGRCHNPRQFLFLLREKMALWALSIGSCVANYLVPGLALTNADRLPLWERMENAIYGYVVYIGRMVFPAGLAPGYSFAPGGLPLGKVSLALMLLAAISAGALVCRKKYPFLLVGWLWYLGMLVPVIGIVQISKDVASADRYTYLPEIGLALAGTWAAAEWSAGWKNRRAIRGGLMAAVLGALLVLGYLQTSYWKDSQTLWTHALACNSGNFLARDNLGVALAESGHIEEAIAQYRKALEIKPDFASARSDLGVALARKGETEEAMTQFRQLLKMTPDFAQAHYNLGLALAHKGEMEEAILQFRQLLALVPDSGQAHYNLGLALAQKGDTRNAIAEWRKTLEIMPGSADARFNLGKALLRTGNLEEAMACFQKTTAISSDALERWCQLGQSFLQNGNLEEAIVCASQASKLTGGSNPAMLRTLAAAYAAAGRYGEAASVARRAFELAGKEKNNALADILDKEIQLYEAASQGRKPQ